MTQFCLARSDEQHRWLQKLTGDNDQFLSESAAKLFPNAPLNEIFRLNVEGKDIDILMLNAQESIGKVGFQKTELYEVVSELAISIDELVFWYGSEFDDLEYVYDVSSLLSKLEDSVKDSSCEAYLHYKKR